MTTIVTAYYEVKSKHKPELFYQWGKTFLTLKSPIIIFVEPRHVEMIKLWRNHLPIHIIPLPFNELEMWVNHKEKWVNYHKVDPEYNYHSPELYAIWAMKTIFVKKAIECNPFHTDFFFWCDFGIFRETHSKEVIESFPMTKYLSNKQIIIQGIYPLSKKEKRMLQIGRYDMDFYQWDADRLGGGMWGGGINGCLRWDKAYQEMLGEYFNRGWFAGKDQSVFLSAYIKDPTIASVIRPVTDGNPWFFFHELLSSNDAPYQLENSYIKEKEKEKEKEKDKEKENIQIIGFPEINPLPVMKCVFTELCSAFDYTVNYVLSINNLCDGGIIFLDDAAGNYIQYRSIYDEIAKRCPTSIFICWYWKNTEFRPFQKMIYTGEHILHATPEHPSFNYFMRNDFVPLKLRASEDPELVGTYRRNVVRDYCYMGGGYRMDWISSINEFEGLYYRVIYDNYLPYHERREIYLSSLFALGFQSDENIRVGHLSQRIFEGLAYGCIVLCENPMAALYTDGIVVYVSSKEDMIDKMRYYKANQKEVNRKRRHGYEWVKKNGTNRVTWSLIMEKIEDLGFKEKEKEKNVYIDIKGGLGNQLFQIATAYAYSKKNKAQLSIYRRLNNGNRATYWDSVLKSFEPYFVDNPITNLNTWDEKMATMYTEIPLLNNVQLNGYFQSEKYFEGEKIKEELKMHLRPSETISSYIQNRYANLISNRDRVIVVHSRRTDYVTHANVHGPLPSTYYKEAIGIMLDDIKYIEKDPVILLCGDDEGYWETIKDDLKEVYPHMCVLFHNESDINSFALLQQFHYFVMSNSTFIWWCVWMAETRRVIAPKQWFGPHGPSNWDDIYHPDWKRL